MNTRVLSTTEQAGHFAWFHALTAKERRTFWSCKVGYALDAMDTQFLSFVIPTLIATWGLSKGDAGLACDSSRALLDISSISADAEAKPIEPSPKLPANWLACCISAKRVCRLSMRFSFSSISFAFAVNCKDISVNGGGKLLRLSI